jgi:uncharacterized protein with von Willebrand factor type A (vWA) domain
MTQEDLLKLLDLPGATPSPPKPVELMKIVSVDAVPSVALSPTALKLDEWGLRRGRELRAESERLHKLPLDDFAAADFHAAAFEPEPELLSACRDARRHQFLTMLMETPDYHALHADTRLNDTAASIAAVSFAEAFAGEDSDESASGGTDHGDGMAGEMATLRAVGKALAEAAKEVEAIKEAEGALGFGPSSPGGNDAQSIAELYRRVRDDPALKRICELAGRFRRVAQSKQRRKAIHGMDDVVGVEPGGEIGRLLPAELAKLAMPELELDTLRRIVERQALCREHHSTEPVAKGPIIVVVDESGSMEGERVHTAKALALAMAWIARQQRRWCGLIALTPATPANAC